MTTVKNIYDYINKIAPYDNAEEWDNTGFLIGDFKKTVKRAVMSLDATKAAAAFAESVDADLILTHHPIIFNPVKNVKKGTALYDVIHSGIAVISAHTSYDKAQGGINDNLAKLLELKNTVRLSNGIVVAGDLKAEMSIDDFAMFTAEILGTHALRYTDTDKIIRRVAVGGGACGEYIEEAMANADCFVTSDLKYHEMLDASEKGFALIDAGHYETENVPFLMLKERLEKIFTDVEFLIAPAENPVMEL